MDPISIAMTLARYAPSVIKYFTKSDKAEAVATDIVNIAKTVAGVDDANDAVNKITGDPALQVSFRLAVMQNETRLDEMYLADVQSARLRDIEITKIAGKNIRANVLVMTTYLVIFVLMWLIWSYPDVNDFVKATASLILGRFLGYADSIHNFEFGTTRSSQKKDDTIKQLTGT